MKPKTRRHGRNKSHPNIVDFAAASSSPSSPAAAASRSPSHAATSRSSSPCSTSTVETKVKEVGLNLGFRVEVGKLLQTPPLRFAFRVFHAIALVRAGEEVRRALGKRGLRQIGFRPSNPFSNAYTHQLLLRFANPFIGLYAELLRC
ncbi:uncharacterized protein LOC109811222 [Cajanus cajan]|uniref:uncharacterized protein LOC109811222 n=1 Tax=Cajanus cajan TaxID=3821 RepID=UPI0010FBA88D|nr:uncharacterized protein LOC109811222 [Cajanus cajan]